MLSPHCDGDLSMKTTQRVRKTRSDLRENVMVCPSIGRTLIVFFAVAAVSLPGPCWRMRPLQLRVNKMDRRIFCNPARVCHIIPQNVPLLAATAVPLAIQLRYALAMWPESGRNHLRQWNCNWRRIISCRVARAEELEPPSVNAKIMSLRSTGRPALHKIKFCDLSYRLRLA